jgi:NAD-dependent dihydropyrimidine dehydrogenase PreA subunit
MKRTIIKIDETKCSGCGFCVSDCPEGALRVIDGKARLIGELLCDGLGACLSKCPEGAIVLEQREAEPYDERRVMANIVRQGSNVIRAHIQHLKEHGQEQYLQHAMEYLQEQGIQTDVAQYRAAILGERALGIYPGSRAPGMCPGSRAAVFEPAPETGEETGVRVSQLTHWPIQLHLVSPEAPQYRGSDLLLAADCVAFSIADFHKDHLRGRTLAIACPKLDSGQEIYRQKLTALIDQAQVNSINVMIMQVPCCSGLLNLVLRAAESASRPVPVTCAVVGIRGEILRETAVGATLAGQPDPGGRGDRHDPKRQS